MSYNLAGICLSITVMIAMLIAFRFVNDFSTVRNKADKHGLTGTWAKAEKYYDFRDKILGAKLGNFRDDRFSVGYGPLEIEEVIRRILVNLDYPDVRLLKPGSVNVIGLIVVWEGYLYRLHFVVNSTTDGLDVSVESCKSVSAYITKYQSWTRTQRIVKMAEEELLHAKLAQ